MLSVGGKTRGGNVKHLHYLCLYCLEFFGPCPSKGDRRKGKQNANHMRNKIKIVLAATTIVGLAGTASALDITLDSLLVPGATLQVGDKLFSNFGWNSATIPDAGVNILTIQPGNPLYAGNYGIDIQGGFTQFGPGSLDADLTYEVQVVGSPLLISDVHQVVNGGGIGDFVAAVSEVVSSPNGSTLASLFNGASLQGSFAVGYATIVPPLQAVFIDEDINITVDALGVVASISDIQQTFSQTPAGVPDGGATAALLSLGLLAVEGLRRKVSK